MGSHHPTGTWTSLAVCLAAILLIGVIHAHSGQPIYSYVDERGSLIATDRLEDVPERYRSRVKVTDNIGAEPRSGERQGSPTLTWRDQKLLDLIDRLPSSIIPGLSTYQSVILIGGFLTIWLCYAVAKFTDSAFLRLLMPWAIGFVALGTLYTMFVSDLSDKVAARSPDKSTGSLTHRFNEKGKSIGEQKQERLKRFDDMTRPQ